MISLKKFLDEGDAGEQSLLEILRLLLEGMGQYAIEGDPDDLATFRASLQRLANSLERDVTRPELLAQLGSVLHRLEDYNRRTTLYLHRPAGEWKSLAAKLTSALASLAIASEQYTRRLEEIAATVPTAEGVDEIQRIQRLLAACLADIQQESLQGRMDSVPAATNGPDPVTGFATRAQAEEALAQAWQTEPASYVTVMVLDRLQIFNMRFGNTVGDEVFRFFGTFLNRQLRTGDRLFRWSDSALMALLPRPGRLEMVRNEVSRLMEARCEHTVQTASRTILLPIVARWTVFPCMAVPRLLIHKIDAFAARESHRTGAPTNGAGTPAGRAGV